MEPVANCRLDYGGFLQESAYKGNTAVPAARLAAAEGCTENHLES